MIKPNQNASYVDLKTQGWDIDFAQGREEGEYVMKACRLNGVRVAPGLLLADLETLGLDITNHHYKIDTKKHRSLTQGVVTDYRFYAPERVDTAWKQSGFASQEAIEYTEDESLRDHLQGMKRGEQPLES